MALDRFVEPSDQHTFVSPYEARIFQYDTQDSNVFISRIVNSVFKIFGDDLIIRGFELDDLEFAFTDDHLSIRVSPGMMIQDNTLIEIKSDTTLLLNNISAFNPAGKIVVNANFKFLSTVEENPVRLSVNYISPSPNNQPMYNWYHDTDRTIVAILEFEKDINDNITNVVVSDLDHLTIAGEEYWLGGYPPERKNLERYMGHMINHVESSLVWDGGLKLENDSVTPGLGKFYGTNNIGEKGWFDIISSDVSNTIPASFTSLSDTFDQLAPYPNKLLQVSADGNCIVPSMLEIPDASDFVTINNDQTIDSNKIFSKNVIIQGDLIVDGDVTSVTQSNINVSNNEIILNNGEQGSGITIGSAGLRVDRGLFPDSLLKFDELTDKWGTKLDDEFEFRYFVTEDTIDSFITNHKYTDTGDIAMYQGQQYDMKLVNGNMILSNDTVCCDIF